MKKKTINELEYFVFENFEKAGESRHCFSTRNGGVSKDEFESLNLSFSRGDNHENVDKNFRIMCDAIGVAFESCVVLKQVHGTKIIKVSKDDKGMGFGTPTVEADGLITNDHNLTLVTFHADCVPLFFLDCKNKAVGLAHAGWRGTVDSMALKMLEAMNREFHTSPKDILVGIGPSIGQCCFQVDEPVVSEFINKLPFSERFIKNDTGCAGKYKIDLWGINAEILCLGGVPRENIEIGNICTKCHGELFYSHRTMGGKRGSMAAFLALNI